MTAFRQIPVENTSLGLDWYTIWTGIQNGVISFGVPENEIGGMYTPPWGLFFLIPFGFLSFKDSWAIFSLITITILVLSVPKKNERLDFVGIILLVTSFPAMRNLADGNLESIVIGGIILTGLGYQRKNPYLTALGILLASIKFQETWLYCFFLIYLIIRYWPFSKQVQMFLISGSVFILSMLFWGTDWIEAVFFSQNDGIGLSSTMGRGSIIDITMAASLNRLGIPGWFIWIMWILVLSLTIYLVFQFKNIKLERGFMVILLTASMLLAPYVSGNSFLTIVAIGIIPLLQSNKLIGITLLVLTNAPYLASTEMLFNYQSYYWTFLLLVVWGISLYLIHSTSKKSNSNHLGGENGNSSSSEFDYS